MNKTATVLIVAFATVTQAALPGLAQFVPPHSNDPHPPANQPRYQLPSPLSRPGVPQFPGAAHSNDPYYTKTDPRAFTPPTILPSLPGTRPPTIRHYPGSSTPRSIRDEGGKSTVKRDESKGPVTLNECYGKWDRYLGMPRADWEASCRRLAASGRIRAN